MEIDEITSTGDHLFQEKPPCGAGHLGLTLRGHEREILSKRRVFAHKSERAKRRTEVPQCETGDGAEESLTVPCREWPQAKNGRQGCATTS
jgi:hypothetical protein